MQLRDPDDRRAILLLAAVWALTTSLWLAPGVPKPDGAGYFVYLPSAWFDHDLLFFDEWSYFRLVRNERILFKEITATGAMGNHWSSGSAVYWLPSFAVGDLIARAAPDWSPPRSEGLSFPYLASCVVASAIAGLLTMFVGYVFARRWYTPGVAAAAVIGVWLGSPLMWYALRNSLMSHAPGALITSLVVLLSLRLREKSFDRWDLLALGIANGFAFAIRPQNATLALIPLILLPTIARAAFLRGLGWIALGGAIGTLPQLVVSQFLYGHPLGWMRLGGGVWKPFAPFERIWVWEPIFSWFHGMLPWTPFLGIAIIGFALLFRDDRRLAIAAIYAFVSQWMINATLERSFWGAYAFGQRRFDNCTIFFILGAAAFFARAPRWLSAVLSIVTIAWSLALFVASGRAFDLNQYQTPSELIDGIAATLAQPATFMKFFSAVPPDFHGRVIVVLLAVGLMTAVVIYAASRFSRRAIVVVASVYLLVVAAFFSWCGLHNAANRSRYERLIAYNQSLGVLSGAIDFRIGLYREEANFLRKSGREAEAVETQQKLDELLHARAIAAKQRGIIVPR